MPLLVLDEQLASRQLVEGLRARGLSVATVADFALTGRPDPDVVKTIDERHTGLWVFVTMDLTIVEEHPGFDWDRYAIAWISVREELTGVSFEESKTDIVHRHAHQTVEQGRGDHHTYTTKQRIRSRPSLASQLRRSL